MIRNSLLGLMALGILTACGNESPTSEVAQEQPAQSGPLLVYASHDASRTASALDAYRSETGTRFQLRSDDMAERDPRLENPLLMPKVDLFVGGSLAELWAVAEADALRPVSSELLAGNISEAMRDPESRWIALSSRARIVAYNTDLVSLDKIASVRDYTSLGDETWRDSLCLASSAVPGNRALIAFLIKQLGVRDAEITVRRWRENLAELVFANDVELIDAVASGKCAVGILDSNVFATYARARSDAPVAAYWFESPDTILFDISGAGVTRHAADPDGAKALLEWLTTVTPNALFAAQNFEFPANSDSQTGAAISAWSEFVTEPASLSELAFLLEDADRLIERARYP